MKYLSLLMVCIIFQYAASAQGYRTNNNTPRGQKKEAEKIAYGKNIITFSPVQILFTHSDQVNPDVAVVGAYERILDNELVSVRLPFSVSLENNYFYFMPTLKLYPKRQGVAKYAVGPQFLIGMGDATYNENYYNPQTGVTVNKIREINRKQFGFLINNSVNFTVAKSFFVGLDGSLGIIYYDNMPRNIYYNNWGGSQITGSNSNIHPAFQLNFNLGYRF